MIPVAAVVAAAARIGRGDTRTFTYTFRLDVSPHQAEALERRFDAARRLFNSCLAECRNRARRMRESRLWTQACKTADPEQRKALFRQARKECGFRLYDLFPFVASLAHGEIGHHLDTATARGLATRAFAAVDDWGCHGRGKPRCKSRRRGLRSLGGAEHKGILFGCGSFGAVEGDANRRTGGAAREQGLWGWGMWGGGGGNQSGVGMVWPR